MFRNMKLTKLEKIFLLIAVIFIGLIIFGINSKISNQKNRIEELKKQIQTEQLENTELKESEVRLEECRKYNKFQDAVSKIARVAWDEVNNCYEHSKELQKELAKLNIKSNIAINEDRSHAWLVVPIEANTGQFMELDSPHEIMEIRNSDLEVICD